MDFIINEYSFDLHENLEIAQILRLRSGGHKKVIKKSLFSYLKNKNKTFA